MSRTHKMSGTRLYKIWGEMKRRCNNPNDNVYRYYGGRGISYTPEWERFEPFYEWAMANGYNADAKRGECTLDRIDCNGNYSPTNCRWISQKEQSRNKRDNRLIEIDGETHTLSEWAAISGIKASTIAMRIDRDGFTLREAITIPIYERQKKLIEFNGVKHTAMEWSVMNGWSKNVVAERIKRGWTVEKALTVPLCSL